MALELLWWESCHTPIIIDLDKLKVLEYLIRFWWLKYDLAIENTMLVSGAPVFPYKVALGATAKADMHAIGKKITFCTTKLVQICIAFLHLAASRCSTFTVGRIKKNVISPGKKRIFKREKST